MSSFENNNASVDKSKYAFSVGSFVKQGAFLWQDSFHKKAQAPNTYLYCIDTIQCKLHRGGLINCQTVPIKEILIDRISIN